MKEREQVSFEASPEHIPTTEEVSLIFKKLTEKKYVETRNLVDEKGLYLLEAFIPGNQENEKIEYAYMRKGRHKEGQISETAIHLTYYKDGVPISGKLIAECINGKWTII